MPSRHLSSLLFSVPLALLACSSDPADGTPAQGGAAGQTGGSSGTSGQSGTGGGAGSSGTSGQSGTGGAGSSGTSGQSGGGGTAGTGGSSGAGAGGAGNAGTGGASGAGAGGAPTYGVYGEPEATFTLPTTDGGNGYLAISAPDVQKKFPEVDWEKLDRLYIPAGKYRSIQLGNLPARSPERPLVITNLGGQARIGGSGAGFNVSLGGGKNWVFTGRYDPVSRTGDAAFRGHAEGAYAFSQDTYGILIDDQLSKEGVSGLGVGGKASDFTLEFLEIRNVEFAGILAKTDNDGAATMRNVRLHDVYIHDTGSEGIYFGSTQPQPQHTFENLSIHDNRILRTGTEALQVGQLGPGCEIHHNVLGPAAIRWRSAFQKYQDGNVQYGQRHGSSSFHHNIVVGTGDLFVEFFPTLVDGDLRSPEDTVTFADNYFSDSSSSGVYTHAKDTKVTLRFERNLFRGFRFTYDQVYPDAKEPVQVFGVGANSPNPHFLLQNRVDAPFPFLKWTFPSVTEQGTETGPIPQVQFRNFMTPALDQDYRRIEWWTDVASLSPQKTPVTYPAGFVVLHKGKLYEALAPSQGKAPDQNPDSWKELPAPADDVRLAPSSPHQGMGIK